MSIIYGVDGSDLSIFDLFLVRYINLRFCSFFMKSSDFELKEKVCFVSERSGEKLELCVEKVEKSKVFFKDSSSLESKSEEILDKFSIYVDNRENTDLIKAFFRIDEIEVESKKLDVGDIVLSEQVAIERKAKVDFVNSIIDKRLFPQLIDLAKNYKRPVLILEGSENLFSIRNLNPNVIRATLSAIAVDLRMPIIYTNSIDETAQMVLTMVKRLNKEKKDISLVANKTAFSENEELEKFVSSIPKVNVSSAKAILAHFKTVKDLINASEKLLLECDGIGKVRAKFLVDFFEREYKK